MDIKSHSTGFVTFNDEAKGKIKVVRKLVCIGSPSLEDVILVKRLTANIISISVATCLKN